MTDDIIRARAARRGLGILLVFASISLAVGAIQALLALAKVDYGDLRFVFELLEIGWRASLLGIAAGAAGWARASGSPLGYVGVVGIAAVALLPVVALFAQIADLGRDVRVVYDVARIGLAIGFASLAIGVALASRESARATALVLAGLVALLAALGVVVSIFPRVFGGDMVGIFGDYGPLLRDALLIPLLVVARPSAYPDDDAEFVATGADHPALKQARAGTVLYRNGLTVKVVAVLAGIAVGILAAGARSAGFAVIVLVLVGGATFVGEVMMFAGLAGFRRQPLGTGGAVDATTGWTASVFALITGAALIVGLVLALDDRHVARVVIADSDITGYATVAGFLGQIFLLTSIKRLGAWLGRPKIEAGARGLLVLFSIVTGLQLLRGMPAVLRAFGAPGALILMVALLILSIIALVQLFGVLRELATALEEQIFLAPFDAPAQVTAAPDAWDVDA